MRVGEDIAGWCWDAAVIYSFYWVTGKYFDKFNNCGVIIPVRFFGSTAKLFLLMNLGLFGLFEKDEIMEVGRVARIDW